MAAASSDPSPQAGLGRRRAVSEGIGWVLLGAAVLVGSLQMDRLQEQGVNAYAAPGLLPGLLGIAMTIFGVALLWRALRSGHTATASVPRMRAGRILQVMLPCLVFDGVLVGHGLPFWLAATLFVATSILILQQPDRVVAGQRLTARAVLVAVVTGLLAGLLVTLVFQQIFLVHLP